MNRVKENEEFLEDVARDMTNGAFHTDLMKGVALSALLDISKSLAVIADKCTYKETGCGSCKRQLDCPIEAEGSDSE